MSAYGRGAGLALIASGDKFVDNELGELGEQCSLHSRSGPEPHAEHLGVRKATRSTRPERPPRWTVLSPRQRFVAVHSGREVLPRKRQIAHRKLGIDVFAAMPEEGLEPPTRGL